MLATALLVFREVLEAALIVTIVLAATRAVARRTRFVGAGIAMGIAGAVGVAMLAGQLAGLADGIGQELLNSSILLAAVAMIGWHVVWMARHGRQLAIHVNSLGAAVRDGEQPLTALTILVSLAVAREGSEIVLFLYGMAAGGVAPESLVAGTLAGLLSGAVLSLVLYLGLLRIPLRHFFSVTNWMLVLLAAGLASQSARYLIQADVLPALGSNIWDSSGVLSDQSLTGQVLHVLVGYSARPAGMQILFYVATVLLFAIGVKLCTRQTEPIHSRG